jgi:hypothetical protein
MCLQECEEPTSFDGGLQLYADTNFTLLIDWCPAVI